MMRRGGMGRKCLLWGMRRMMRLGGDESGLRHHRRWTGLSCVLYMVTSVLTDMCIDDGMLVLLYLDMLYASSYRPE